MKITEEDEEDEDDAEITPVFLYPGLFLTALGLLLTFVMVKATVSLMVGSGPILLCCGLLLLAASIMSCRHQRTINHKLTTTVYQFV